MTMWDDPKHIAWMRREALVKRLKFEALDVAVRLERQAREASIPPRWSDAAVRREVDRILALANKLRADPNEVARPRRAHK